MAEMKSNGGVVDGATDTLEDAASEEDRLRAEAARRLERRRRKMMSPEERLARITGKPVSQTSPSIESPPSSGEHSHQAQGHLSVLLSYIMISFGLPRRIIRRGETGFSTIINFTFNISEHVHT